MITAAQLRAIDPTPRNLDYVESLIREAHDRGRTSCEYGVTGMDPAMINAVKTALESNGYVVTILRANERLSISWAAP